MSAKTKRAGWHYHSWTTDPERTWRVCAVCMETQAKRSGKWQIIKRGAAA